METYLVLRFKFSPAHEKLRHIEYRNIVRSHILVGETLPYFHV